MDYIIIIAVILFAFRAIIKGAKNAAGSNPQNRSGAPGRPPYANANRPRSIPPLTPTAGPGTGAPSLGDMMAMLGGAPTRPPQDEDMEGVSTEYGSASGSLSGAAVIDDSQPDYEGASLPGELSADAVATLPKSEEPISAPLKPVFQSRRNPAAMRDAVVWAEILAKPKAMRRVAR